MKLALKTRLVVAVALLSSCSSLLAALPIPAPPTLNVSSYFVVDANTGKVIAAMDPDKPVEPASLTKLMTAFVVFQALRAEQIQLADLVTISRKARQTEGSRMFVEQGSQVSVENLLQGMIVQSGNDASVALAEHIAGSEEVFAGLMNAYAQELGMVSSHFENATGLPGTRHIASARDLAILARAIIDEFPEYYRWYGQKSFAWGRDPATGDPIEQDNRNKLLWRDSSVDGMKTGYTQAAGYCLVSSAERNDMRLITVVTGAPNENGRFSASQSLLNYGFRFFETRTLYAGGDTVERARVWKGTVDMTSLGVADDVVVTIPRGRANDLQASVTLPSTLQAPLNVQSRVGRLSIVLDGEPVAEATLVALEDVPAGGLWKRMTDSISLWFE
ncbi:MAG: D-alanyl-D-alanine carboxypeptidase family protein [Pseudomonadota bacterium]